MPAYNRQVILTFKAWGLVIHKTIKGSFSNLKANSLSKRKKKKKLQANLSRVIIFYHSLVLVTLRSKILILLCMREMARKSHSVNFMKKLRIIEAKHGNNLENKESGKMNAAISTVCGSKLPVLKTSWSRQTMVNIATDKAPSPKDMAGSYLFPNDLKDCLANGSIIRKSLLVLKNKNWLNWVCSQLYAPCSCMEDSRYHIQFSAVAHFDIFWMDISWEL